MKKIIWILTSICAILYLFRERILHETFIERYMFYKSKCFSCEKDLINRYGPEHAYLGQPTKGFSEERELIARTGKVEAAFEAHPL